MPAIKNEVLGTTHVPAKPVRPGAKWSKRKTLGFIVLCIVGFWGAILGAAWGVLELLD